ncbi:outer membrane protein assembly factor BamE [Neisseriaceae bacterium TC5R-5]|nr:outer membrane protein assembly factor BamE [Neisseriaceae bacterium TC5R-5]
MRVLIFAAIIALAGCGSIRPYTMEVQQGNFITEDSVAKLKLGMTPSQVRFLLGTPLLLDPFHNDRWDYSYRVIKRRELDGDSNKLLSIYFKDGVLERIDGDAQPSPHRQAAESASSANPIQKP